MWTWQIKDRDREQWTVEKLPIRQKEPKKGPKRFITDYFPKCQ